MGMIKLISQIFIINKIFGFHKGKKKLNKRERFIVAIIKVGDRIKNINYAKNINSINKQFDMLELELCDCIKNKPWCEDINIGGYKINKIEDFPIIKQIRKGYIKVFLLKKIEIELKKSSYVSNVYIKDRFIKRALLTAMEAIEHLPDEGDLMCKISELEDLMENSFNNKGVV